MVVHPAQMGDSCLLLATRKGSVETVVLLAAIPASHRHARMLIGASKGYFLYPLLLRNSFWKAVKQEAVWKMFLSQARECVFSFERVLEQNRWTEITKHDIDNPSCFEKVVYLKKGSQERAARSSRGVMIATNRTLKATRAHWKCTKIYTCPLEMYENYYEARRIRTPSKRNLLHLSKFTTPKDHLSNTTLLSMCVVILPGDHVLVIRRDWPRHRFR